MHERKNGPGLSPDKFKKKPRCQAKRKTLTEINFDPTQIKNESPNPGDTKESSPNGNSDDDSSGMEIFCGAQNARKDTMSAIR